MVITFCLLLICDYLWLCICDFRKIWRRVVAYQELYCHRRLSVPPVCQVEQVRDRACYLFHSTRRRIWAHEVSKKKVRPILYYISHENIGHLNQSVKSGGRISLITNVVFGFPGTVPPRIFLCLSVWYRWSVRLAGPSLRSKSSSNQTLSTRFWHRRLKSGFQHPLTLPGSRYGDTPT